MMLACIIASGGWSSALEWLKNASLRLLHRSRLSATDVKPGFGL
jgi:hypothetical protein